MNAGETTRHADSARETVRAKLLNCLGGPWPDPKDLCPRVTKREQKDGYRLEWVSYETEPDERVMAVLIVPDGVSSAQAAPGIAVWHQHAGQWHLGKSEPACHRKRLVPARKRALCHRCTSGNRGNGGGDLYR